jgi:predicted ABC-class ATPase
LCSPHNLVRCSVSTILVIGGSGEYLSVADKIYRMEDYKIQDVTFRAKEICRKAGSSVTPPAPAYWSQTRRLLSGGFSSYPKNCGTEKLEVSDMGYILIGDERIDIRMLHNIASAEQLNAIGLMLRKMMVTNTENIIDLDRKIDALYEEIEKEGLDCVFSSFFTTCERFLDLPRRCEVKAVINRMRGINFILS